MKIGAPQGATLGPLLLIVFMIDLHKHLSRLKSIHLADDTILYLDINPSTEQHETLIVTKKNHFSAK